jgi:hypothetical protein
MSDFPGRHRDLTRRRWWFGVAAVLVLVALLIGSYLLGMSRSVSNQASADAPAAAAQPLPTPIIPAPAVNVDQDQAPAPGMDPEFAPPDGPALDSPPFDVDAYSMRDELRGHGVDLPDEKLGDLVKVANKYIAEDVPDLTAWDPRIAADVKKAFPKADRQTRIDVVRCTAEYIERVIARNHGWAHPPDEDDHAVPVGGNPAGTPAGGDKPRPR